MPGFDHRLTTLQHRIRSRPLLYRLTLGTRVLLAVGFIPSGMVKLLGHRFSYMSPESDIGGFFETLYQSGPYWHFLGLAQVVAGVLVLWPRTATLGALLFCGIMSNIFVITLSYDFNYTPVVTGLMLLATLYLLVWDYDRLRGLVGPNARAEHAPDALPRHRLSGVGERAAYVGGVVAGLGFFAGTRGVFFPWEWNLWFLLGCVLSFAVALWYGLLRRGTRGLSGHAAG
jgi:uncharacterized membrane protein YphA (DoxX/SURF4 family)